MPKKSKTVFIVELINGRNPLTNVIKSSVFDATWVLDTHLSKFFHHGFFFFGLNEHINIISVNC